MTSSAPGRQVTVIGAPSAIGLRPYDAGGARNVDLTPQVLREHDLIPRLNATDLGDVIPPAGYADLMKPVGRGRNEEDVAYYSHKLAERIGAAGGPDQFLVVLGGDCSILLGALLGARAAVRDAVGVMYIDAHADFATLAESASGSACSMNLALAVGRSETPLARLSGDGPLVRGEHVVHIGRRDDEQPEYGYPALPEWDILELPQARIESEGIASIAAVATDRMAGLGGYWIHFDVDVIDPQFMPAVDTPIDGGLDFTGAEELLATLISDRRALGLDLAIYDPSLDNGTAASGLVDLLASAVRRGVHDA